MLLDKYERATRWMPKVIDRNTHAALDYLTVSAFFIMGSYFWGRHKRATATALINGLMVLGVSMFTDYRGSAARLISFRTHGDADLMQAATAASLPTLLGFGDESAAVPFRLQALNELFVVGATDWGSPEAKSSTAFDIDEELGRRSA